MAKKIFMVCVAVLFIVCIADAQTVGTYQAAKAKAVTQKIKKPHNPVFLGLNAGVTGTVGTMKALDLTAGADVAFSINKKFALGLSTGYETPTKVNVGLLFVHGNYAEKGAFLWGAGFSGTIKHTKTLSYEGIDFEREYKGHTTWLRLGFQTKSPLYYNFMFSVGELYRKNHYPNGFDDSTWRYVYSASITLGYKFNTKLKK